MPRLRDAFRSTSRAVAAGVVTALAASAPALGIARAAPRAPRDAREAPDSARAPVTLGEVASSVDAAATTLTNLLELLRHDAEVELASIDWRRQGVRRRYTLSAAVVRLESVRAQGGLQVTCTVSAAVRDERGALVAILEGRARAEELPGRVQRAERGALAGATRGAIGRVPEALRRLE